MKVKLYSRNDWRQLVFIIQSTYICIVHITLWCLTTGLQPLPKRDPQEELSSASFVEVRVSSCFHRVIRHVLRRILLV